jgi:hypothetical protein
MGKNLDLSDLGSLLSGAFLGPLQQLRTYDRQREGVPGEHWATLAMGVAALVSAERCRTPWMKWAAYAAGGALLVRAASGRDGLARLGGVFGRR